MPNKKHATEKTGRKPRLEAKKETRPEWRKKLAFIDPIIEKYQEINTSIKLAAGLTIVLAIIGVVALVSTPQSTNTEQDTVEVVETQETEQAITAQFTIADNVEVKDESGEWVRRDSSFALEGFSIRTVGAVSRAEIQLNSNDTVRVAPNSELEITSLADDRVELNLVLGYAYNRVESDNLTYVVTSRNAQYEALGTAFLVTSNGDEQSVSVFESSVQETTSNLKPSEGQKLIVVNNKNPNEQNVIRELDIEDIKNDTFIQWNIERDLESELYKNKMGFLRDTESPPLTITSHTNNETVLLDSSATEATIQFTGTTEKDTELTVRDTSNEENAAVTIPVKDDGSFESSVLTFDFGTRTFEFVAIDRAGNVTTESLRLTLQKKSAPVSSQEPAVALAGEITTDAIALNWIISNSEASDGVYVVWNETGNPQYGTTDESRAVSGETILNLTEPTVTKDTTYFIAVCIYNAAEDTCSTYSNVLEIEFTTI